MKAINVSNDNWQAEVINADLPTLVQFGTNWVKPSIKLVTTLETASDQRPIKSCYADIDSENCEGLALANQVTSVPTLLVFKNGQPAARMLGSLDLNSVLAFIDRNL